MKTLHYKVEFKFSGSGGGGWIDGYTTARAAKTEVERVNATTHKTGVSASYLGYDGRPRCLCGGAYVGDWTNGHHHDAHRCALVITRL